MEPLGENRLPLDRSQHRPVVMVRVEPLQGPLAACQRPLGQIRGLVDDPGRPSAQDPQEAEPLIANVAISGQCRHTNIITRVEKADRRAGTSGTPGPSVFACVRQARTATSSGSLATNQNTPRARAARVPQEHLAGPLDGVGAAPLFGQLLPFAQELLDLLRPLQRQAGALVAGHRLAVRASPRQSPPAPRPGRWPGWPPSSSGRQQGTCHARSWCRRRKPTSSAAAQSRRAAWSGCPGSRSPDRRGASDGPGLQAGPMGQVAHGRRSGSPRPW